MKISNTHCTYYVYDSRLGNGWDGWQYISHVELRAAYDAGMCRLVHSYKSDGGVTTYISIDGIDCDTRGKCHMMSEAVWTQIPDSWRQVMMHGR